MIDLNCLYCKGPFKVYPCLIRKGYGKFCSMSCREGFRWSNDENKLKASIKQKQICSDPNVIERMRESTRNLWKDQKFRDNMLEIRQSEEYKNKIADTLKFNWKKMTKVQVEERLKNIFSNCLPNSYELFLYDILSDLFPNEYMLNVNAEIVIGKKVPDFVNINGQKKLIELFGDRRFKNKQNEAEKIKHFGEYGFKTLVIWDYDLKDLNSLKHKLVNFHTF